MKLMTAEKIVDICKKYGVGFFVDSDGDLCTTIAIGDTLAQLLNLHYSILCAHFGTKQ